ncbi:MAG: response regulator [Elusimicrobia bacterium]|nr:response regulator [Elusimicrobiota bacterium]
MSNKRKKILVIEDNPLNREIVEVTLKKEGYNLVLAVDGEDGLQKLEESPDLVLLDLSLPKISGWDIIKKIRKDKKYKNLPVIALTAHAMVGDREKAIKMGCNAYLPKPCLPKNIIEKVKNFI